MLILFCENGKVYKIRELTEQEFAPDEPYDFGVFDLETDKEKDRWSNGYVYDIELALKDCKDCESVAILNPEQEVDDTYINDIDYIEVVDYCLDDCNKICLECEKYKKFIRRQNALKQKE